MWAGGATPVLHRRRVAGLLTLADIYELAPALQRLRADTLNAARA